MRVLGIDPGSRFTGYGVVEDRAGKLAHIGHGVIRADANASLEARLQEIFLQLSAAAEEFKPDAVAVEGLFSFRNARSALVLGHARGIALLVAAQRGLAVHEYAPAKVKKAVGAGGADGKDAVARMVRTFLRIAPVVERADATDALAVAICHLHQGRAQRAVSQLPARGGRTRFEDRLAPAYRRFGGT